MLTHNDQTVKDARKIFNECKDLPIEFWGFKNIGISEKEMKGLVTDIHNANKKAFLEVVTYSEQSCFEAAKFACDNNFDYLLGTLFYPSVWEYIKKTPIQYYPFVGDVTGNPSKLCGSIESIIKDANDFYNKCIPGIDVLAYRYESGDPEKLANAVTSQTKANTIIAGSINSIERIETINDISPWAFTIGSALITHEFVPNTDFRTNLERVIDIMNSMEMQAA